MTVRAIVFDLDGTLVDSSGDIAAAMNAAFAPFDAPPLARETVLSLLGGGARNLVQQCALAAHLQLSDAQLDAAVEDYSALYRLDPSSRTVFFEDAHEALPQLAALGIRLGICTNKRSDIARAVLDGLGVGNLFDAVVGIDEVANAKPHPDHLAAAFQQLGIDPADGLYVGDTHIDSSAASALGVAYVQVSWGHADVSSQFSVTRFIDLLPIIEKLSHGKV